MNNLKVRDNKVTMSSREIAKETGKRHDNVLRDIEKMLKDLKKGYLTFEEIYSDSCGRFQKQYLLPYHELMILLTGYSTKLRDIVLSRWEELENQNMPKLPATYKEALLALVDIVELNERKSEQLKLDKPFSNFGKSVANSSESIPVCDYAKVLNNYGIKIGRNKLFNLLRKNGFLIKAGRSKNSPFQRYINMGIFEIKETVLTSIKGDLLVTTYLITGKGQIYLLDKIKNILNI